MFTPARRAATALATTFLLSPVWSAAAPIAAAPVTQATPAPTAAAPEVSRREELLAPAAATPAAVPASSGTPAYLQKDDSSAHREKREKLTAEDLFGARPVQRLQLREAIQMALQNNLDARFEKLGIDIQKAQVKLSASVFDPVLGVSATYQKVRQPQDINNPTSTSQILTQQANQISLNSVQQQAFADQVALQQEQNALNQQLILQGRSPLGTPSAITDPSLQLQVTNPALSNIIILSQEGYNFQASLSGRTPIGTRYALAATMNESRNTFTGDQNPVRSLYTDSLVLQIQQPLLKNFGTDANLADLRVARIGAKVQVLTWKNNVQNAVQGVMAAYYDMVASLDSMRVLEDAIGADSKLTDLYRRRVELGFGSPFDVQQAAVQVSTDREALLVAKNNFLERQYALKRLVLAKFESSDPRLFFPENTSNLQPPPLDRAGFLATAFENRYDYRGQVLNAESQNIRLRFARNQLLPELDLVATYGLNGLGYSAGSGFSDTFSADHPQFSVGVQFQYPQGNRQAKAQLQAAVAQKEQAILRIKQVEIAVGVGVDTAISRIETNRQRLEAARKTRELADEAVRIALRRLEEGQISSYDITEQQRRVYDARTRELGAQAELNKAVTILWLETGTILPKEGITFHDDKETRVAPPAGVEPRVERKLRAR